MVTATIPDLLRLLVVPVFGWAAYRDIKTRRVPNRTWAPLAGLGLLLLAWDLWLVTTGGTVLFTTLEAFLLRTAISVGFVVPFAYFFWRLGGFGGADAKALMTLAIVFPTYPHFLFEGTTLPVVESAIGVFSLTILSNTVLAGAVYPVGMALRNAVGGDVSRLMVIGRRAPADDEESAEGPEFDDPWGAEAFFEDVGGPLYGTGPDTLREGLEVLTTSERVWYSPGLPFIVPMFGGLLISLTAGDVLIWLLGLAGLA